MGKFREQKISAVEAGEKKGDVGIGQGEQRVRELKSVKNMIDSLVFQDEIDVQQAEMLEQSYLQAGREAHQREVKNVVDSAKGDLEANKGDISAEREKVEDAIRKVGDMKGTTDLARNQANRVEGNLKSSATEYKGMETETERIEAEQERKSQNILSRIESIFG